MHRAISLAILSVVFVLLSPDLDSLAQDLGRQSNQDYRKGAKSEGPRIDRHFRFLVNQLGVSKDDYNECTKECRRTFHDAAESVSVACVTGCRSIRPVIAVPGQGPAGYVCETDVGDMEGNDKCTCNNVGDCIKLKESDDCKAGTFVPTNGTGGCDWDH